MLYGVTSQTQDSNYKSVYDCTSVRNIYVAIKRCMTINYFMIQKGIYTHTFFIEFKMSSVSLRTYMYLRETSFSLKLIIERSQLAIVKIDTLKLTQSNSHTNL